MLFFKYISVPVASKFVSFSESACHKIEFTYV